MDMDSDKDGKSSDEDEEMPALERVVDKGSTSEPREPKRIARNYEEARQYVLDKMKNFQFNSSILDRPPVGPVPRRAPGPTYPFCPTRPEYTPIFCGRRRRGVFVNVVPTGVEGDGDVVASSAIAPSGYRVGVPPSMLKDSSRTEVPVPDVPEQPIRRGPGRPPKLRRVSEEVATKKRKTDEDGDDNMNS